MKIQTSLVSFLLAMCTIAFPRSAQDAKPTFSIAISAPSSVRAGSSIPVNIMVTNTSNHVIAFDALAVDGERNFHIDVVDESGSPAAATQYMKAIRGDDQGSGPQIVLGGQLIERDIDPGATLKQKADISKLFDLKPGTYTVTVWRSDLQIGHMRFSTEQNATAQASATATRANPSPYIAAKAVATSNTVKIAVLP